MNDVIIETNKDVLSKIEKLAKKRDCTVVKVRKVNDNPSDDYLRIVMCKRNENEYCTWLHNSSYGENGEFFYGHYGLKNEDDAFEDFVKRT